MIRFACECGKHLSAAEKLAGEDVQCPDCGEEVTVPEESTVAEDQFDTEDLNGNQDKPDEHPREKFLQIDLPDEKLGSIHETIVQKWDAPLLAVNSDDETVAYTIRTGTDRTHAVRLMVTETENDQPILLVSSRIGTAAKQEEIRDALLRNTQLFFGRIQMEADNSLYMVHSFLLNSLENEEELLPILEYICVQSDRIEREMFGVDLH